MAKPKPDVKRHTQKTVSTNAMFKRPGKKTENEAILSKIERASKATKGSKKQRKVKPRAEHPLAVAFSGQRLPHAFWAFLLTSFARHHRRFTRDPP